MALGLAMVGTSVDAAETGNRPMTIRVYDSVGVPKAATRMALDVAAHALEPASVDVTWVTCSRTSGGRCGTPLAHGEIMVRLVRSAAPATGATDESLGTALVDPVTGTGVLATVYVDRVERLAASGGTELGTLLGRAIAHEIGHLLMGRTAHGISGLMRPRWTRDEVVRNVVADWRFATADLQAIRSLAARP